MSILKKATTKLLDLNNEYEYENEDDDEYEAE
jgi:hypothetical protein